MMRYYFAITFLVAMYALLVGQMVTEGVRSNLSAIAVLTIIIGGAVLACVRIIKTRQRRLAEWEANWERYIRQIAREQQRE